MGGEALTCVAEAAVSSTLSLAGKDASVEVSGLLITD